MRLLASLTLLAVAVTCRSQWVNPDEYERMLQEQQDRRRAAGPRPPDVKPQSVNDVDSTTRSPKRGFTEEPSPYYPYRQPSLIEVKPTPGATTDFQQPRASAALMAPTPDGTPSLNPFDTFLPPRWRDHVIKILSTGITKFALDMDRAIEGSQPAIPDSTLFSPVCLTTTLAMVMLASGGKTFDEVARILGLESGIDISHHSEVVHQIFGLLINEANKMSKLHPELPQSKFAFGIFVEDDFPVRKEFRDVSEKVYNSEVISVDFSHRGQEAQKTINDWVSNRTEGKIKNMLADPPIPSTEVIITSALYFSGEWNQHFFRGAKRRQFAVSPNETVYVDMMNNGGNFPFYEDKKLGVKIIGFPYKGRDVTMYALLPTETGAEAVKNLKRKLDPEVIEGLIGNMKDSLCLIGYPKMKLSSTLRLQSALEALGLKSLFDQRTADLSVLSPGRNAQKDTHPPNPTSNRVGAPWITGGFKQPLKNLYTDEFSFPTRSAGLKSRSNLYSYEDPVGGYMVEQWDNGYHFEKTEKRTKRQTRPIDREFIDFLNHQKLPTFGVDELRNSAGISNPGLYADDVIHKVEMTVNEMGTEAAAATSVVLDRSGDYKRFVADRPFLFFIRHDSAKALLFWGTVNRPAPYYNSL